MASKNLQSQQTTNPQDIKNTPQDPLTESNKFLKVKIIMTFMPNIILKALSTLISKI